MLDGFIVTEKLFTQFDICLNGSSNTNPVDVGKCMCILEKHHPMDSFRRQGDTIDVAIFHSGSKTKLYTIYGQCRG